MTCVYQREVLKYMFLLFKGVVNVGIPWFLQKSDVSFEGPAFVVNLRAEKLSCLTIPSFVMAWD